MDGAFWGAVVVAAVSGQAYIAYRHPEAYAGIYKTLAALWTAAMIFFVGFVVGWKSGGATDEGAANLAAWMVLLFLVATMFRLMGPALALYDKRKDDKNDGI